jgi:hypothetical protein
MSTIIRQKAKRASKLAKGKRQQAAALQKRFYQDAPAFHDFFSSPGLADSFGTGRPAIANAATG